MAIVKCPNGHYFDNKKYENCPFCEKNHIEISRISETVWANRTEENQDEDGVTVGAYSDFRGNDYVVGWLVCVDGPDRGKDYRLHQGYNRIGRDQKQDINPVNDLKISRSCHCSIVYENIKNRFYFVSEPGKISYLNSKLAEGVSELNNGDTFQIGESEFEFIAFCREGRNW